MAEELGLIIELLSLLVEDFISLIKLNSLLVNLLVTLKHFFGLLIKENGFLIKLLILSIELSLFLIELV